MLLSLGLTVFASACSSAHDQLEQACRQSAGVEIYDSAAWATYLSKVQAQDLVDQRTNLDARKTGQLVAPPDIRTVILPFPYVTGYRIEFQRDRYANDPQPGDVPERNDATVWEADHKIGTLRDFDVTQRSFGYSRRLTCTNSFPEIYAIKRKAVLK